MVRSDSQPSPPASQCGTTRGNSPPLAVSDPGEQDVLEELPRPAARAAVDVAAEAAFQAESGLLEDLRVEVAAVVDDDQDGSAAAERLAGAGEDGGDALDVGRDRGLARAARGGAELELAQVVEVEQLVSRAVLLVVVDQPRIGRRGEHGVEDAAVVELTRIPVHDVRLAARTHARERLDARERVERVAAQERQRVLHRAALALVLVAP